VAINARSLTSAVYIKLNGSYLSAAQMLRVHEVTVEQSLHLPDMFEIHLDDVGDDASPQKVSFFKIVDSDAFSIGTSVEIALGRSADPTTVCKGEITAIELNVIPEHAPTLVVRGYARSHRLHRGRQSKSYQNVADSDVATTIAQQAGLQAQTDPTSVIHDYLYQNNQTGWEFLRERATRLGYELFVDDTTMYFRKPKVDQEQTAALNMWDTLLTLQVKISSAYQAGTVIVRGWDPQAKQPIVGTATHGALAPSTGIGQSGAQIASGAFGDSTVYVVNRPVDTGAEANALAQAVFDSLDGSFIHAEGTMLGNPSIKPGVTAPLGAVGSRLSGKYYVTSATHSIADGDYKTTFVVSGRQTNSLIELLDQRHDNVPLPSVVVGVVTDNTDPDKGQGRVKVKFPWLVDNDQSWWARIASPMAGSGRGFFFLPEVDDEVLVSFEHGDITRPYILGALWNGQDAPPKKNSEVVTSSQVNERLIKTRAGHIISLNDTDGSEMISIIDKTGNNLVKIESSSNKITIQADGDILIQAKGKVSVIAQDDVDVETQANATVKAQQNVDVEAMGNATVKATGNASVEATGNLNLKGAVVNLEAQGTMSIKANGPLTIQGAMVSIN
jgi:phage protein D/phage baseplate assembly protein gpV